VRDSHFRQSSPTDSLHDSVLLTIEQDTTTMLTREVQLLITIFPSIAIAVYLARRAIAARPRLFRLSDYFLAGGQIGPTNTRANAVGSNIALANGLWYFIVLGYDDGVVGIVAQVTWCLSIYFVGFIVPDILASAKRGETLHGFLSFAYGSPKLRSYCAFVTCTGYLLNFGFETYMCGTIFASILGGDERLKWIMVLAVVLTTSLYIAMAGFLGNVTSDRKQNTIGIATILAISGLALFHFVLSSNPIVTAKFPQELALSALASPISWNKYLGILAYASLFSVVDVSNWQGIAANKYLTENDSKASLKFAWTQTAVIALFFPGAFGVLIGCLLRSTAELPHSTIFGYLFTAVVPTTYSIIQPVLLGLLLMGLFVMAIGYSENLLSSAQLTLMADFLHRDKYDQLMASCDRSMSQIDFEEQLVNEDRFVRECQRTSFLIAFSAMFVFVFAMALIGWIDTGATNISSMIAAGEEHIFGFMFLIFGSAISMFPAILLAIVQRRKGLSCKDDASRYAAIASIASGFIVAMSPLIVPAFTEISPVFTVVISASVLVLLRRLLPAFGISGALK
jgi:hypothetical protein